MTLLQRAESSAGWLRDAVEALVRLESPSTDKAAVDRCGDEIARRFAEAGGRVHRVAQADRGDHLRVELGAADGPGTLVLGHFDTVWPVGQLERMPIREVEGRLHGPGVFDMKAGVAVALAAVRLLQADGASLPRVVMLWTTDEEIGSGSSRALIESEARASRAVLVLEPSLPGGAAKTARKGCGDFSLTVHGVSAHAGIEPGKGANALHELAHQIVAIQALQDPGRGISVNVTVASAGSRTNVIPDRAQAAIDVRVPTMADARAIEAALAGLIPGTPGTRLEITGGVGRPPLERSPGVARLYEQARAAARELGRDLGEGSTGGGSDGNFTAALGVPTLDGLGPQGDGAHALHEHVLVADLGWRAALLATLLARLEGVQ
jgi:glutamate carboxypeptidase